MTTRDHRPTHYHHGSERRRKDTLVTTVQALFGGSVIYRVFAHFMKEPEFEAQVMRIIPKEKLPLIAAAVAAAGAIGLLGQRSKALGAEKALTRAIDEMTAEAAALRGENAQLKRAASKPAAHVQEARHDATVERPKARTRANA